jgi:hypothetical protein
MLLRHAALPSGLRVLFVPLPVLLQRALETRPALLGKGGSRPGCNRHDGGGR